MASTPQTVASSPAGSPEALTIVSSSSQQTPQTISSDPPELALVGEVIQIPEEDADEQSERSATQGYVSSSSEDVEVLEAQAETARARVREAEMREKHEKARARRSRTVSSRASAQSISSARFSETPVAQPTLAVHESVPAQPTLAHAQTSQLVRPVHAQHSEPVLPVRAPGWLGWFERHAPAPARGPTRAPTDTPTATEPAQSTFLSNAYVAALEQQQGLQAQQQQSMQAQQGVDNGAGVRAIMTPSDHDAELKSVRARVRELEEIVRLREEQASYASAASAHSVMSTHTRAQMDMSSLPSGLSMPVHHHEHEHEHACTTQQSQPAPPDPPPTPPSSSSSEDEDERRRGNSSSSSSESEKKKKKRKEKEEKKKAKQPYKIKQQS